MPRTILCGLDIGTSKVCCVIAEQAKDGAQRILGFGAADHRSIREGHVIDLDGATDAIQAALSRAETEARVVVRQCLVNVSVPELQSRRCRGAVPLADHGMEIRGRDVERVRSQAELLELALDRAILHSIPVAFSVDGQMSVDDPLGLVGRQLAVELLIITCPQLVLQNITKAVHLAGLEVQQFIYSGMATAHGVLTAAEREQQVLVIDIGGSITDVVCMAHGRLAGVLTLPVGGATLTQAILQRCKVQPDEAEALKREAVLSRPGEAAATLTDAAQALLAQIHEATQRLIAETGEPDAIIMTGRTALLDGLLELVEERYATPVRLGRAALPASYFGREPSLMATTAIGLLESQRTQPLLVPISTETVPWPRRLLVKARELYEDYF